MAKSIRSKVKRSFRNKKREEGVYAATEAARLARLHAKLTAVATNDADGDAPIRDAQEDGAAEGEEAWVDDAPEGDATDAPAGSMDVDGGASSSSTKKTKISTHGPRNSRREEWRVSKGMPARPKSRGMNRQGGIAAARNSGRSHRRR